jgi:Protein of unknown function (DUF3606)
MADNRDIRGPTDERRVNVGEDYEVRYWCDKWDCTPDQLRAGVKAANSVTTSKVGSYLRRLGWVK